MNKAVILCGGLGTRFLPITKTIPKELLPVVDVPVLSYIIDECVKSGLNEILIVISPRKQIIKDYFGHDDRLSDELMKMGKPELAESVNNISYNAEINFVVQQSPLGSAHAVSLARPFTGDEPFALALGDDLISGEKPALQQLISVFEQEDGSVLGVQKCESDDIVKYGVVDLYPDYVRHNQLRGIVEKPPLDKLPSRLACYGRYVFKDIYSYINRIGKGKNGEYQLTDAIMLQCKEDRVFACEFEGKRYDMGNKLGALQASIELSLKRDDFGSELKEYIIELARSLK